MKTINLEYEIGQDIYTIVKNGGILQPHKTLVSQIIIDKWGITYKIADNMTFGGLLGKCYRENGKIFKFATREETIKKIEEINKRGLKWKN